MISLDADRRACKIQGTIQGTITLFDTENFQCIKNNVIDKPIILSSFSSKSLAWWPSYMLEGGEISMKLLDFVGENESL